MVNIRCPRTISAMQLQFEMSRFEHLYKKIEIIAKFYVQVLSINFLFFIRYTLFKIVHIQS